MPTRATDGKFTKNKPSDNMCNRIEDLIEKARHYENLWHDAVDENKFLKLEIERLKNNIAYLDTKLDEELDRKNK